jgi:hypothetical protein
MISNYQLMMKAGQAFESIHPSMAAVQKSLKEHCEVF